MKKKTMIGITLVLCCIALVIALSTTSLLTNLWGLTTGRGYFIPKESSVFTFTAVVMNEGSGEWWLYGEDADNYYSVENDKDLPYILISKKDAAKCPNFIRTDHRTWRMETK